MSSSESGEEYEVESIRGRRLRKGKVQYLLRWKGYEEQTWTDKEDCGCDALIRAFESQLGRDSSDADATILVTPRPEVERSSRRSRSGNAATSTNATKTPKSTDRSRSSRSAENGRRSVKSDQTVQNEAKKREEKRKSRSEIAIEKKKAEEERHETSSDDDEVAKPPLRMRKKSTGAKDRSRSSSSSSSSGDERMARLNVRRKSAWKPRNSSTSAKRTTDAKTKKAAPVAASSSSTTTTPEKSPKKANLGKSKANESSTTTSSSSDSPVKTNLRNKKTAPAADSSSSTTTTPDQTPKRKAAPVIDSSSSTTTTPDERPKRTNGKTVDVTRSVVSPKKKKEATPEDDLSRAESEDSALSIQFVGIRRSPIKRAVVDLVGVDESTPEPEEEEKEEEEERSKRTTRSAGENEKATAAVASSSRRRRAARDEEEEEEEKEKEQPKRRRMSILENSAKKSIKRAASPILSPRETSMERGEDGEIILPSIQSPESGLSSPGLSSPITLKNTLAAVLKAIPAVEVLRELEKTDRTAAAAAAKVLEQSTIALGPENFPKFRVWTRAAYEEWMAKNEKGADFLTHNDGPGSERFLGRRVEGIVGYVARGSVPFCLVKSDIKGAGKLPLEDVIIGVETTLAAKILTKSFTAFTTNLVYLQQLAASIVQKSDDKQVDASQNTSNGVRRTRKP